MRKMKMKLMNLTDHNSNFNMRFIYKITQKTFLKTYIGLLRFLKKIFKA